MTANNITLIIVAALLLVAFGVFMSAPKYQPYRGSNYYGGGNVEEQLAFIGGWSTQMRKLY